MVRIQTLACVALLFIAGACFPTTEGAKPKKERTKISVDDPNVLAAKTFAQKELRKLCDYCNDELRDTYQNMEVKTIRTAEAKPTSLSDGTMFFLRMTLESTIPYQGKSTDSQTVIVFQNADGTYNGISVERSPFLDQ
mmetsp:Transcript_24130/g.52649  ORF Transcript_24130/g.52649 Transcript_24130/m.52649 type:complete len:138 (-) Transcript_24130:268-681(-)